MWKSCCIEFSKDTSIKSICYGCKDIGQQDVELWVTDATTGQQAFCRTYVEIQDNNSACIKKGTFTGTVSGLLSTNDNQTINEVEVKLEGSNKPLIITKDNGRYAFIDMPYNNNSYTVIPSKNTDF